MITKLGGEIKDIFSEGMTILRMSWKWLILYIVVDFIIYAALRRYIPDYGFLFGRDEYGDPTDMRSWIAILSAFPVTYMLVLGYKAWKYKWNETDDIVKQINDKYGVAKKLKEKLDNEEGFNAEDRTLQWKIEAILRRFPEHE